MMINSALLMFAEGPRLLLYEEDPRLLMFQEDPRHRWVAGKFIPREDGRKVENKGSTHETNKYTAFTDGNKKIICYRVQ